MYMNVYLECAAAATNYEKIRNASKGKRPNCTFGLTIFNFKLKLSND